MPKPFSFLNVVMGAPARTVSLDRRDRRCKHVIKSVWAIAQINPGDV
jgi:hypothetical protein